MNKFAFRWRSLLLVAVLAAPVLLAPTPTSAADEDVVAKMTAGKIERIMKAFSDVKDTKEVGDGAYSFTVDGLKVLLTNKGSSMQLQAWFDGEATLSRINEWNRTRRFTQAYTTEKGEPALESDILLTGGVTERNVKEWMKMYVSGLEAFKKHLAE